LVKDSSSAFFLNCAGCAYISESMEPLSHQQHHVPRLHCCEKTTLQN